MKLWKITQTIEEKPFFYDSAVVAAIDENTARHIHPSARQPDEIMWLDNAWHEFSLTVQKAKPRIYECWVSPSNVQVEYIGETDSFVSGTVIVASMQ